MVQCCPSKHLDAHCDRCTCDFCLQSLDFWAHIIHTPQILLHGNEDPFGDWVAHVSEFLVQTSRQEAGLSSFDTDLIRLFQFFDVINSIARSKNPGCPDFCAAILEKENRVTTNAELSAPLLLNRDADYILSAMWNWAVLQKRMHEWVANVTVDSGGNLDPGQEVTGMEIVCTASSLQAKMLQLYMDHCHDDERDTSIAQVLTSFSYWTLIGISQQLRHPNWQLLQCDLPVMTDDWLRRYAVIAINSLEVMIDQAGLCVAVLLPAVFTMGSEMASPEERGLVIRLLGKRQALCPVLTEHFQIALIMEWELGIRQGTGVCYREVLRALEGHPDHVTV